MQSTPRQVAILLLALAGVFFLVVAVLHKLMPGPRRDVDYLVMGALATFACLGVLFLVLINTWMKGHAVFFKRRKPEPGEDEGGPQ